MEKEPLPQKEKNQSNNKWLIIIIILFGIALGWMMWQRHVQNNEFEVVLEAKLQLAAEKDSVKTELNNMLEQYDLMTTTNDSLNSEIAEQQEKIKEYLVQIDKHKNDEYLIRKLKKETTTLREIMKGYLVTIDSLNTLNKNLVEENTVIKEDLTKQKVKYTSLKQEKEVLVDKVKIGARLKTLNIAITAFRTKANGDTRETLKAEKTSKIKCCFTLDENKVAEKGEKDVYLRIIAPNGKVLAEREDESSRFTFNGVRGLFSVKKTISYSQEKQDVCMYWEVVDQLPVGDYIFEVYADEADIGKATIALK